MKKANTIIGAMVITVFLLLTSLSAGDIMSVVIHKKSNIIGATVSNVQGEKLGEISDLVFDKDTGNITYVVLSHEGVTGNGEKMIPVPLDALRFINDKNVNLNMSMEKLASAPGFEKANLPDMTERQWNIDTHKFYGVRPYWE